MAQLLLQLSLYGMVFFYGGPAMSKLVPLGHAKNYVEFMRPCIHDLYTDLEDEVNGLELPPIYDRRKYKTLCYSCDGRCYYDQIIHGSEVAY